MAEAEVILGGRYRLRARIGVGGMGEVWWGTDVVLRRVVAVKLVRPDHGRDEEGRDRFRAEGRHAAALAHSNIVCVYDYGEAGPYGLDYLVMEYIDGPSLARLLDGGPLDPAHTMNVVAQAARGLQAAHEAGVVHRDVKPANLLVSRDGRVAVTDFGIAYAAGSVPVTRAGLVMGSPAYMAPERVSGNPATPASDLYALGVVAYECLTGRIPFDGEPLAVAAAHIEATMPPLPPSVPADVARLVADLTARDPAARPASAAEVAVRAERLRADLSQAFGARGAGRPVRSAAGAGPVRSAAGAGPVRSVAGAGPVRSAAGAGPVRSAAGAGPVRSAAGAGPVRPVRAVGPGRVIRPVRPVRPAGARRPAAGGILLPGRATVTLASPASGQDAGNEVARRSRGAHARTLALTALPMGGLAVAGLVGWVLATGPPAGPGHQPSAAPGTPSPTISSPSTPGGRSHGATHGATHRAGNGSGKGGHLPAPGGPAGPVAPVAAGPVAAGPAAAASGAPPAAAATATQPAVAGNGKHLALGHTVHAPKAK
jgi:serine/threonine-protein kinase